jgi:circadian clock protein KaiC
VTPAKQNNRVNLLPKSATGIPGMDEITGGGLPKGRPTLVAGAAGCGKTLFAMEFLVNGAVQYEEPGVFVAFEENAEELTQNVASLGFDLKKLIKQKKMIIDYVRVERSEIEETGDYDLEGLFIRLGHAIDSIGAKRVVLDTIEVLFSALSNQGILRAELQRLFRWLKDKGVSAVITAERGSGTVTRFGLEEYVADCVILLDHRVTEQMSTRRLRIVKYRGTLHGTNEYPFLITRDGISVLPITSVGLDHHAPAERVPTGVKELDEMLGGRGYYKGSSILLTGTAGSGKSSLAAAFVNAACRRGEKCLYLAFEEATQQILRNMRSIGIDLAPHVKKGLLQFHIARPTLYGLEMHLVTMYDLIREHKPQVVVLDPITDFFAIGSTAEVKAAITRIIDFLKTNQITALFTSYTDEDMPNESVVGVSSLIDTWISLRNLESNGERHRGLFVLKSRGMSHSNQIRSFQLTDHGIQIGAIDLSGRRTGSSATKEM